MIINDKKGLESYVLDIVLENNLHIALRLTLMFTLAQVI